MRSTPKLSKGVDGKHGLGGGILGMQTIKHANEFCLDSAMHDEVD